MNLSAFIAEDEVFGREELKHHLSVYPELILLGESDNGIDAVKNIKELRPDLLFLDIEMPGLNGLQVIESLSSIPNYKPFIIIVTAYDNHAVKAFEYDVVDYLLKPIDTKRFSSAMSRVLKYFSATARIDRITAKRGSRIMLIPFEDISYVYMENSIVYISSKGVVYSTTYRTMEDIHKELGNRDFFRTHRGFIVNLKKIREIKQEDSGVLLLKLEDTDVQVPVARAKAKDLKSFFNL
ncbi:MAG: LytTR family transcriptional regulator DNA-binding domain-containing protein [bacterium]